MESETGHVSVHPDRAEREPRSNPSNGGAGTQTIVPPYWQHQRGSSYASLDHPPSFPITLEDHTEESSEQSDSLWANGVSIENYVVISGNIPSVGDYVVWICSVDTIHVSGAISALGTLIVFSCG